MKQRAAIISLCVWIALNAFWLRSELLPVPNLNDNVLHLTLVNGIIHAVETGGNPFDFWTPEIGLGEPIARLYQTGAHLMVAALYFVLFKSVSAATVFLWFKFIALVTIPASFFWCARLLGLSRETALAAAVIAPLVSGDAFGIDWNSYLWGGHGLFPQLVATHFLLWTIGLGWRAVHA